MNEDPARDELDGQYKGSRYQMEYFLEVDEFTNPPIFSWAIGAIPLQDTGKIIQQSDPSL